MKLLHIVYNLVRNLLTIISDLCLWFQLSPLEAESGSLKVGRLSTPLREYSLHLLAAAAARCARSCTSSSVTYIEMSKYVCYDH